VVTVSASGQGPMYIPIRLPIEGGMSEHPQILGRLSTLGTPKHQIHDDSMMMAIFPLVYVASCSTNVGKWYLLGQWLNFIYFLGLHILEGK